MGIIYVLLFTTIGVFGLIKTKNKTTAVKITLIVSSLLLLTIQILFASNILTGLELVVLSSVFAAVNLILIFKKRRV